MATKNEHNKGTGLIDRMLMAFDHFQTGLENKYEKILRWTIAHRKTVLASALILFFVSMFLGKFIAKTFLPPNDLGEFTVTIEKPVGTSLNSTFDFSKKIEAAVKALPEVDLVALTVGSSTYESNKSDLYVHLVPSKQRRGISTTDVKEKTRAAVKEFTSQGIIAVTDVDISGGGQKPLNLYIVGDNLDKLSKYTLELQKKIGKQLKKR